jgi:Protein of unknown function (DUF4229)
MWLYSLLRFGLFFALWGLLYLIGLRGFVAPIVALVLSVPLSLVLLSRPRAMFTRNLEARVQARLSERAELDARLDPDSVRLDDSDDSDGFDRGELGDPGGPAIGR